MALPSTLRSRSDLRLRNALHNKPAISRALRRLDEDRGPTETRRQLLAGSVRLTKSLAPQVHKVVDQCREALSFDMPLELFVYPSASYNAAAARPEDGRGFVLLASSLLEAFEQDELAFVVGHELGHHVFEHHEIPVSLLLSGKVVTSPAEALELFAWSRFAEISADRAGLYCCRNLDAAGRAFFKLSSGLRAPLTDGVVQAMLDQMGDIEAAGAVKGEDMERRDWISTHPFSPLRIKASKIFDGSELMQSSGGVSMDEVETQVEDLLQVMEIGYLKASSDEGKALRRVLLAAGMVIADASDGIEESEIEALEQFLGDGTVTRQLNVEALRQDLDSRVRDANERASVGHRLQMMRDLTLIARADGSVSPEERKILRELGDKLELAPNTVDDLLASNYDLD